MKILLDECCPRPLAANLAGFDVFTVEEAGLKGIANGLLIDRAELDFDVFITADKNLRYQQNLTRSRLAIIELPFNSWPRLLNLVPVLKRPSKKLSPASTS